MTHEEIAGLIRAEPGPDAEGNGFTCRTVWTVAGSVGHWGHLHTRRNRYEAVLTVRPDPNLGNGHGNNRRPHQ